MQNELDDLQYEKWEKVNKRIKHARSFCDFWDDSEYDVALKERLKIDERIILIKQMIQNAHIIERNSSESVELESTVSFQELPHGDIETYIIVGSEESNPILRKISYTSPFGSQLIGGKIGEIMTVKTPANDVSIKVIDII